MADQKVQAEELLPLFETERLLNQDQDGRRVSLYGQIRGQPAVLVIERAPFPTSLDYLSGIPSSLTHLQNLGANDVYRWYLGSLGYLPTSFLNFYPSSPSATRRQKLEDAHVNPGLTPSDGRVSGISYAVDLTNAQNPASDLKLNLFYPATEKHVRKYSAQRVYSVRETPEIYRELVRPWIEKQRTAGRLKWIYDILDGKAEVEDVIYRTPDRAAEPPATVSDLVSDEQMLENETLNPSFVLLPDLNWDRQTASALHLLALVLRRDVWSVRCLTKQHLPWLRALRTRVVSAALLRFPELDEDSIKLYVHYQPTYYHFHVHVVHVQAESGGGSQAVGKAISFDSIIELLEMMSDKSASLGDGHSGNQGAASGQVMVAGMQDVSLTYTIGEQSELWSEVWEPLKKASGSGR